MTRSRYSLGGEGLLRLCELGAGEDRANVLADEAVLAVEVDAQRGGVDAHDL